MRLPIFSRSISRTKRNVSLRALFDTIECCFGTDPAMSIFAAFSRKVFASPGQADASGYAFGKRIIWRI